MKNLYQKYVSRTISIFASDVIDIHGEVADHEDVVIHPEHVAMVTHVSVAWRVAPQNGVKTRPWTIENDVSQIVEAVKFHTFWGRQI